MNLLRLVLLGIRDSPARYLCVVLCQFEITLASGNMDSIKFEIRVNIKFLVKLGWKKPAIIKAITDVYGDNAPKKTTLYEWINRFNEGRENIEDDSRSGRPSTSVSEENIRAVEIAVKSDNRTTVQTIAQTVGISVGSAEGILKDKLNLSKLSSRWVPKLLREDQQALRADHSLQFLNKFDADSEAFLNRIVTGDETWIYQFDPESKQQSKQWLPQGSSAPIKAKAERSAMKLMATIFWDSDGVLLIDFLERGRTITASYYETILRKLHAALKEKRPGKIHQRLLFHQDNAPAHSARSTRTVLREYRWEILPQPPYSPDLAPSDFFLFPRLKKDIKGVRWQSMDEAKRYVVQWLESKSTDF